MRQHTTKSLSEASTDHDDATHGAGLGLQKIVVALSIFKPVYH